ncbi:hypothetical protein PP707_06195 [Acetobacter pasteurianus]|uniref:Uncharacterized protein n=1 Tax=Lodderomyces elongisporus (strain ATCC 11503 / CBS 2605 / JCM 1781 / NBRC 1676 / NRRL YB-4239) TaxID=379508 RepID=A5E2K0_LODEL|nr:conserved hypothetical protein [Lodderomyces elongisporus NRRL YB-4239]MDC6271872.1 hypothetical protein [Acetobacter pasteurianus]
MNRQFVVRKVHNAAAGATAQTAKSIPYQPVPQNRFNPKRSAFNFKPKYTSGLVHNPPSAILQPSVQTPYLFLPPNDPRREMAKANRISPSIIQDMPIIREYRAPLQRDYSITAETVQKLKQLYAEDPVRWNLKALSKEFNIDMTRLRYFFKTQLQKAKKMENLQKAMEGENEDTQRLPKRHVLDRKKRREMWMRNEY